MTLFRLLSEAHCARILGVSVELWNLIGPYAALRIGPQHPWGIFREQSSLHSSWSLPPPSLQVFSLPLSHLIKALSKLWSAPDRERGTALGFTLKLPMTFLAPETE